MGSPGQSVKSGEGSRQKAESSGTSSGGKSMGDREGTFWIDKEKQERLISSEARGVELGGSVGTLDGVCFACL